MSDILAFLSNHGEAILLVVSLLLAAAGVVAKLTPSETDNKVLAAIKGVVDFLAGLVKRSPAPPAPPVVLEGQENQDLREKPSSNRQRLDR